MTRRLVAASAAFVMFVLLPASASSTPARYGPARLASLGPAGGNGPYAVFTGRGTPGVESRAYFSTHESLVAEDVDGTRDVYETDGRSVSLVTVGPPGGSAALGSTHGGSSLDGSRAFFNTPDVLVPEDVDGGVNGDGSDVYERAGGMTTLISTVDPACSDCNFWFAGASDDGRRVFFENGWDIYENFGGVVTLVGTGRATFLSNSADGAHVFFHSRANLVAEDQDNCGSPGVTTPCEDFYERTGGETRLISTGPSANGSVHNPYGNGFAASRDGEHAVFATLEQLVPEDTDTSYDIYDRAAGQTRLVSTGPSSTGAASVPLLGTDRYTISEDGTRVVFITNEQLVPEDQDALHDVYLRAGDTTTLVSTGPKDDGAVRGVFPQMTPSGDRVFFQASGHLTARDTDSLPDLYEWSGGQTKLVSIGPAGGNSNCEHEEFAFVCHPGISGISRDGSRVFFFTQESLVARDTDQEFDVYVRAGGRTMIVTQGSIGGNGAFHAGGVTGWLAVPPSGKAFWFTTAERLAPADTDDETDLYVATARK